MKLTNSIRLQIRLFFVSALFFLFASLGAAQQANSPQLVLQSNLNFDVNNAEAVSADGKRAAVSQQLSDTTFIIDVESKRIINFFKLPTMGGFLGKTLIFSHDGRKLAVASSFNINGGVDLFDVESGDLLRTFQWREPLGDQIKTIAFTPDDKFIITGGKHLRLWETASGKLLREFAGHGNGGTITVSASADGKTFASAGEADNAVKIWNLETGAELRKIVQPAGKQVVSIAFSRDGQILRGLTASKEVIAWNTANGKEQSRFSINTGQARFNQDGETLTTIDADGNKFVWNLTTRKPTLIKSAAQTFYDFGELDNIQSLQFTPPNLKTRGLIIGGLQSAKFFPFAQAGQTSTISDGNSKFDLFAYSPNGKYLAASTDYGGKIKLLEAENHQLVRELSGDFREAKSLAFSADGKFIAAGTDTKTIIVWDAESGATVKTLTGYDAAVEYLSFGADGKRLFGAGGKKASVWNLADDKAIFSLAKDQYAPAAMNPDGKIVVVPIADLSGGNGVIVGVYDVETGAQIREILPANLAYSQQGEAISALAFSSDGQSLAIGGRNGFIELRNAANGDLIAQLAGQRNVIETLVFERDVKILASASEDKEVALWSVPEQRQIADFYVVGKNDWAIIAPDARFEATPKARQLLHWLDNGKPAALEKYAPQFETNNLFAKLFNEKSNDTQFRFKNAVKPTQAIEIQAEISSGLPKSAAAGTREIVVPLGHGGRIWAIAYSPDKRAFASLSGDGTVKLWNARTGREIRTLSIEDAAFASLAFSPDGKTLATGKASTRVEINANTETILWNVATGERVQTFAERGANVGSGVPAVAFSRDGKLLASCIGSTQFYGNDSKSADCSKIVVREIAGGNQIRILNDKNINNLIFDAEGKNLICSAKNSIKFYDLATGKTIKTFDGHEKKVLAMVLDASGKILASASEDKTIKLWDAASGNLRATLAGHTKDVNAVSFSPNGEKLLSGSSDGSIRLWSVANAAQTAIVKTGASFSDYIYAVAFDAGGEFLAGGLSDGTIKIWDAASNTERHSLRRQTGAIKTVLLMPDGNLLAATEQGTANWQLDRLRLAETSAGGVGTFDFKQRLGEIGKIIVFSADLKTVALLDWQNKQILVGNLETKQQNKIANLPIGSTDAGYISRIAISDDGRIIAAAGDAGIKIWNATTGVEIYSQSGAFGIVQLKLNKTGTIAAIGNNIGAIGLLDTATKKYQSLQDYSDNETLVAVDLAFGADDRVLAGALANGEIKIWEIQNAKQIKTLAGNEKGTNSIIFHSNGKILISGGADARVRLWDWQAGKETASLVAVNDRDFVAMTPDGFYSASKLGAQAVSVRQKGEIVPFEQFDRNFNRPDILLERVGLAAPETIAVYRQAVEKRLQRLGLNLNAANPNETISPPVLSLVSAEPPAQTKDRTLVLRVKAEDAKYSINNLQAVVNGVPIFGAAGLKLDSKTKSIEREIKIELARGANKIRVFAVNERGASSQSLEFETRLNAEFARPNLFVVVVGVSDYADARNRLRYAAKDAEDVAKFFESKRPRFGKLEILRLLDAEATRENIIKKAGEFLARADVEDEVVVFVSGHGLLDARRNYFYATQDIDFKNPADKGLPFEALEDLMDKVRARKKLLLMDTCHAGEADKTDVAAAVARVEQGKSKGAAETTEKDYVKPRGVEVESEGTAGKTGLQNSFDLLGELFADFRSNSGTQIIAAASGVELAYERGDLRNGVFTHSLLESLTDESADTNQDGKLQVFELRDAVNNRVRTLTNGAQTPVMRQENIEFDFGVF